LARIRKNNNGVVLKYHLLMISNSNFFRRKVRQVLERGTIKPTRFAGVVVDLRITFRSHVVLNVDTQAKGFVTITGRRRLRGGRPLALAA